MTTAQKISSMQNLKRNGILEPAELNDELNPKYLFSLTYSELLCAIVNGKIDAKDLRLDGSTEKDVERQTGINRRTIQRYRQKYDIHRK